MPGIRHVRTNYAPCAFDAECPVCLSATEQTLVMADYTPVHRGYPHNGGLVLANLFRCQSCTLLYFHPRPSLPMILAHYDVNALAGVRDEGRFLASLHSPTIVRRDRAMLDEIERHTIEPGEAPNGRRMLDVGCLFGTLVAEARRRGYETHGIEPDPLIGEHLRRHVGEPIHTGYLDTYAQGTALRFSLITMVDTLEHHLDPRASLELAAGLLEEGGHLYIEVPNAASATAEHNIAEYRYLEFPGHLNYFTMPALCRALEAAGLEVVMRTTQTHSWEIPMVEHVLNHRGKSFEDQFVQDELTRTDRNEGLSVLARRPGR